MKPDPQIPLQESTEHWFTSFYLKRDIEHQQLYDMPPRELDVLMAELKAIIDDEETRRGKWLLASFFFNLATTVRADRTTPTA